MLDPTLITEEKMVQAFGKNIADKVKRATSPGKAIFTEFSFKGKTYVAGYDNYRNQYYTLNSLPEPAKKSAVTALPSEKRKTTQPAFKL